MRDTDVFHSGRVNYEPNLGAYYYMLSPNLPTDGSVTASAVINLPDRADLDKLNSADGKTQLRLPEIGFPIVMNDASVDVFVAYDTGAPDSNGHAANSRTDVTGSGPGWFANWYTGGASDIGSNGKPGTQSPWFTAPGEPKSDVAQQVTAEANRMRRYRAQSVRLTTTANPKTGDVVTKYEFFAGKDAKQMVGSEELNFKGQYNPKLLAKGEQPFRIGRWAVFAPNQGDDNPDKTRVSASFQDPTLVIQGQSEPWAIEAGWTGQPRNIQVEPINPKANPHNSSSHITEGERITIHQTEDYSGCKETRILP
jgi:hypothetical protein